MHCSLCSMTPSQLAFPGPWGKQPEFPMGGIPLGQYRCQKSSLWTLGYNRNTNISTKHSYFVIVGEIHATTTKTAWKMSLSLVYASFTCGKLCTSAIFLRSLVSPERLSDTLWSWPGHANESSKRCAMGRCSCVARGKGVAFWIRLWGRTLVARTACVANKDWMCS